MVVVYGIKSRLNPVRVALSDAIQQSLVEVLGLPEDKRAQRFVPLEADDYYYPAGRSDAYTVIEVNMMAGRKAETKKALIKALFKRIEAQVGIAPLDVEITIKEQPAHCWGFRGMTGDEATLNYSLDV